MLRVTVLGTGYVGLVSGVCLAELGHHVTCIDTNVEKITALKKKKIPIYEEGLEELLNRNVDEERLYFSTDLSETLNGSDIVVIAVGTPIEDDATGAVNLSYIEACVAEIAKILSKDMAVVIKSTVPVGTCDKVQDMLNKWSKHSCSVISNPEFLREGNAVYDFMTPDRIVIGCDERAKNSMQALYSKHIELGVRVIYTDRRTSELIKYASNTFLAMKVSFINEISDISEKVGADIKVLSEGIGSDKRIGNHFLNPGPGFGGSCFPKDVKALINLSNKVECDSMLIKSIVTSNWNRCKSIVESILQIIEESDAITVFGLTYKAETDDVRDSPAIEIIKLIQASHDCTIKAYDPEGLNNARKELGESIIYCEDMYEACEGSSLVVIMTEWNCFKNINAVRLRNCMRKYNIYDVRAIIDKAYFAEQGFNVKVIGYGYNASKEVCSS